MSIGTVATCLKHFFMLTLADWLSLLGPVTGRMVGWHELTFRSKQSTHLLTRLYRAAPDAVHLHRAPST